MKDSFSIRDTLKVRDKSYAIASLNKLGEQFDLKRLPYSLKILLENLLRKEDGENVTKAEIEAIANWDAKSNPETEIAFMPARVVLQDFTGVPCVVDLAAMRDAVKNLGGDPTLINPQSPVELVIDHSVQVDAFGSDQSIDENVRIEFERNQERYAFLRWGQSGFDNFKVVPPRTGIVHQVNLEYLSRVVMTGETDGESWAYPDTLFGTDSHTTMVNGLGVLGWGVGGIEAEAAMLGQPSSMLIPRVVGFKLTGKLPEGATATDLVLTVTEMLRKHGVVGKFVEFYGNGLQNMALADRATIGNMSPEFGSTCAIFPIDDESLRYLQLSGRSEEQIELVEQYVKTQGLWHDPESEPDYSESLELDLATVKPSVAGPKRPQDRIPLVDSKSAFRHSLKDYVRHDLEAPEGGVDESSKESFPASDAPAVFNGDTNEGRPQSHEHRPVEGRPSKPTPVKLEDGTSFEIDHGAVVIAAITSCTNTSNPAVMIGAGLLARNARKLGLNRKPWVKTSLAPGSKVVTDYLEKAGLIDDLEELGFYLVGYGCTTCIGNSGPLQEPIAEAVTEADLAATAVLSGNRNFEGRIHPLVKMNYLASPPLVVAYALAGSMDFDLAEQPLGQDQNGKDVFLKDIWPSSQEISDLIASSVSAEMFKKSYADVFKGDERWNAIQAPEGDLYDWSDQSTYIKNPPYFDGMKMELEAQADIEAARCLGLFGDSITTDHISPAGAIKKDSPAGKYLIERGVEPKHFNSYGSRRGNDDVMVRGTFANIRIKNRMLDDVEGGFTLHVPSGEQMAIYDAAMKYQQESTPLVVLAGKEYGSGSSRDWAAKGTLLLGVKAVIAESFERIHRSNLVGMGVLPLQFKDGDNPEKLGLDGTETFAITGLDNGDAKSCKVTVNKGESNEQSFDVDILLLTPKEREFYRHGGILQYVLRDLASRA